MPPVAAKREGGGAEGGAAILARPRGMSGAYRQTAARHHATIEKEGLDRVCIQLSPLVLKMQIVDVEERGFLECLDVRDRQLLATQNDQVLCSQFLQGTIDVHVGQSCRVREIALQQRELAAIPLRVSDHLHSDEKLA